GHSRIVTFFIAYSLFALGGRDCHEGYLRTGRAVSAAFTVPAVLRSGPSPSTVSNAAALICSYLCSLLVGRPWLSCGWRGLINGSRDGFRHRLHLRPFVRVISVIQEHEDKARKRCQQRNCEQAGVGIVLRWGFRCFPFCPTSTPSHRNSPFFAVAAP